MLDQVNINLNDHDRRYLANLGDSLDVERAPEIGEWKKVSMVWHNQPPDDTVHLFVKLPSTSESKSLLQMEHHSEAFFPSFRFLLCSSHSSEIFHKHCSYQ